VHDLRSADESDRGEPIAEFIQRAMRGRDDCGMVRKPEVVVRTEVDDLRAFQANDADGCSLRCRQDALCLKEAFALEGVELFA